MSRVGVVCRHFRVVYYGLDSMYVFLDGELKIAVEWTFEAEINYL